MYVCMYVCMKKLFSPYEIGSMATGKVLKIHLLIVNVRYLTNILELVVLDNSFMKQNFVKISTPQINHNLKIARYFVRVSMKSFKKSFLKHECNDTCNFLSSNVDSFPNQQWYEMALDLIDYRIWNSPT